MKTFLRLFTVGAFVLAIAACARQAPVEGDLTPPPRKPYDAKTQLETGRVR
ncbi:MAG: hypothetical protein AB7F96_16665 [Beijerinckiaceae bacterium]